MHFTKYVAKKLYRFPSLFDKIQLLLSHYHVQDKEQLFLENLINTSKIRSIIQIGANDGMRKDPIRQWIVNRSISAVLIEPDPDAFAELKRSYKYLIEKGNDIQLLNKACITEEQENLKFCTLSAESRQKLKFSERVKLARKASLSKEIFYNFLLNNCY